MSIRTRAFSLIESLVALMIFSVAIVAIIQGLTIQIRSQQFAEDTTRAILLSQNILEEIRFDNDLTEIEDEGDFEGSNEGFSWWYKIENTETVSLSKVTVRINWGVHNRHDYTVETYLADT